jgi:enoyl-CoA hydratase/carnithine racemase
MAEYKLTALEKKDGVAYVTLNNPPANAISPALIEELKTAFTGLEKESEIKVVVLKSANEKMFSAGADITILDTMNADEMVTFCDEIKNFTLFMRKSNKVYIASIEGHCLGGGLELAMSCDLRVAKEGKFKMGLPEVNLGLFPGGGGIQLAGRIAGMQKAFRLAAFGEILTAAQAAEWGLVDYLYPEEGYAGKVEELAAKIARSPSVAIAKIKQLVYFTLQLDMEEAFAKESVVTRELLATKDVAEGIRAFKEKRVPEFKGF